MHGYIVTLGLPGNGYILAVSLSIIIPKYMSLKQCRDMLQCRQLQCHYQCMVMLQTLSLSEHGLIIKQSVIDSTASCSVGVTLISYNNAAAILFYEFYWMVLL